jgi:hypothetical protein
MRFNFSRKVNESLGAHSLVVGGKKRHWTLSNMHYECNAHITDIMF